MITHPEFFKDPVEVFRIIDPGALLSSAPWQRRFGGSPAIIGQVIEVDGRTMTIVAVAPRGFEAPAGAQLWVQRIRG
jgi:hypothetical protein